MNFYMISGFFVQILRQINVFYVYDTDLGRDDQKILIYRNWVDKINRGIILNILSDTQEYSEMTAVFSHPV